MEFLSISWKHLHEDIYSLAKKIEGSGERFDLIVAIARGGMTITQILSDFLSLPVATFTVSSYKDLSQNTLSDISFHIGGNIKNKRILLVDDISDTGKTFERGIKYLHNLGTSSISTASLFVKDHSQHVPDYFVTKTNCWVVFPYEIRETIISVEKIMKHNKESKKNIKKALIRLGFKTLYIKTYLQNKSHEQAP